MTKTWLITPKFDSNLSEILKGKEELIARVDRSLRTIFFQAHRIPNTSSHALPFMCYIMSTSRQECQYDGGDCCACTCVQSTYSCPPERFKCVDPDAECLDEDDDGWPVQVEAAESSDTSGGTMTSGGADTASTNDSAYDDDVLGGGTLQNDSISVDWGEDSTDRNYAEQDLSFLFSHCFSTAAVKDGVCDSDSNDQVTILRVES